MILEAWRPQAEGLLLVLLFLLGGLSSSGETEQACHSGFSSSFLKPLMPSSALLHDLIESYLFPKHLTSKYSHFWLWRLGFNMSFIGNQNWDHSKDQIWEITLKPHKSEVIHHQDILQQGKFWNPSSRRDSSTRKKRSITSTRQYSFKMEHFHVHDLIRFL